MISQRPEDELIRTYFESKLNFSLNEVAQQRAISRMNRSPLCNYLAGKETEDTERVNFIPFYGYKALVYIETEDETLATPRSLE